MKNIIEFNDAELRFPSKIFTKKLSFSLQEGEQIALVGDNASGKGLLIKIILGEEPLKGDFVNNSHIKHLAFRDSYGMAVDNNYYYQQRWNSSDAEAAPLVRDAMKFTLGSEFEKQLFSVFNIEDLLDKQVVLLSSGELRKLQIVKILLTEPKALILENPFIGLDAPSRVKLEDLLMDITQKTSMQLFLALATGEYIPKFITHVVKISDGGLLPKMTRADYMNSLAPRPERMLSDEKKFMIENLPLKEISDCQRVVDINNISIRYGEKTILKDLTWKINKGEKWALMGYNGAGKSTLLSLICADNPQGYACDIRLFGLRRGVEASIWDIKKNIGYLSPEMHRAYHKSVPCIEIVGSGLYDTVGLNRPLRDEHREKCLFWLDIFGVKDLATRDFCRISSSEQRLVLLARAFVKDPELLILDEPLHGLDYYNVRLVLDVIDTFCSRGAKTLIFVSHYQEYLPSGIKSVFELRR